jgi:hypothetical protein
VVHAMHLQKNGFKNAVRTYPYCADSDGSVSSSDGGWAAP